MLDNQIGVDAATTARLLGIAIPLLVAFIAKKTASQGLKGVLNSVSSVIIGSLVYLVAKDGGYNWTGFVNSSLDTLIPSITAYYALWKPTGLAGTVANILPRFGIGSPPMQTEDVGAEAPDDVLDGPVADTMAADDPTMDDPMPNDDTVVSEGEIVEGVPADVDQEPLP